MADLTERQLEVLCLIDCHTRTRGFPPTLAEIANHFGISSTGAKNHVLALIRKGMLRRTPSIARGLSITDTGFDTLGAV